MINELYRWLNLFIILFASIILAAFQSVVLKLPIFSWLELDLLLLVIVFLSLHRTFVEGIFATIVLGRLVEIHSSSPVGIILTSYLAVFISIFFAKEMFLVGTSFSNIILSLAGGVIWKSVFLLLSFRYGLLSNTWVYTLEYTPPYLLSLGVFARPVFSGLRYLDRKTKMDHTLGENELSGEEA